MQAAAPTPNSSPGRDVRSDPAATLPCLFGREHRLTYGQYDIRDAAGELVASAARAPRLLQLRMLEQAALSGPALRQIPDDQWMSLLEKSGKTFASGEDAVCWAGLVSRSSGLPRARVLKAYATLRSDLARMHETLTAQAPNGNADSFRCGRDAARSWRLVPQGRHLAVRIPGNFPTININWLISLALRRPVLLCASLQDPFTPYRLAQSLYEAGVPENSISLCFHDAELFWQSADQVLMSGDPPTGVRRESHHLHLYHHGRSKAVLAGCTMSRSVAARLALQAVQGCGRLCTNVSAVLADEGVNAAAEELASALSAFQILPLDDQRAVVPSFPDRQAALAIAARISAAVARGARDVTAKITGRPLVTDTAEGVFLRPTLLLVKADDAIFGSEFPFPFVTVANVPASEFLRRCRNSLAVSVVGGKRELIQDLICEPTIDKVFWGDDFDHGYDPAEPHEGFLADFLFRKKVVFDYADEQYCRSGARIDSLLSD